MATLDLDATIKGETKSGKTYSYQGISSAQVVARAKAALIRNGVLYMPEVDAKTHKVNGNKTSVWINGVFENVDDPADTIIRGAWGEGTDNADNGSAKAFTNANKQILTKTLNMTTVEDDTLTAVEHEPESKSSAVRNAEATTEATIKSWADAYREALRGCTTKQQLGKVRAENAHMMKNPTIPQPTKDYFADMISELESVLS